jgi:3-isopropylmalate dehydrogenase
MLEWLDHPGTIDGAQHIRSAVEQVLADPANRTPDLGGRLTTQQMGGKIIQHL